VAILCDEDPLGEQLGIYGAKGRLCRACTSHYSSALPVFVSGSVISDANIAAPNENCVHGKDLSYATEWLEE
jgi:hypothetical protein